MQEFKEELERQAIKDPIKCLKDWPPFTHSRSECFSRIALPFLKLFLVIKELCI